MARRIPSALIALVLTLTVGYSLVWMSDTSFIRVDAGDLTSTSGFANSVAWGDWDGDGDEDVLISTIGSQHSQLFTNNGDGTFTQILDGPPAEIPINSGSARLVDYDNDGDLDIVKSNLFGPHHVYRNDAGTFVVGDDIGFQSIIARFRSTGWADYDQDGLLDVVLTGGNTNYLFHNNGDGTFSEITDTPISMQTGDSTCPSWGDYDNDGDPDLFVGNTDYQDNFLYRNDGEDGFVQITDGDIVNDGGRTASCNWIDYDHDDDLDLYITGAAETENVLYQNNGDGTFTKLTDSPLTGNLGDSNGTAWADYNLDGHLDVYIFNRSEESNVLFLNDGAGSFTQATTGMAVEDMLTHPAGGTADYDLNGTSDILAANLTSNEPSDLYQNTFLDHYEATWLGIRLKGTVSNSQGLGARVRLQTTHEESAHWQMREHWPASSLSQHSQRMIFGLGGAETVASVEVHWPSGIVQYLYDVPANQHIDIMESAGPTVESFTLINADTDEPVPGFDPIEEDAFIDLNALGFRNVNIRANVNDQVESIAFSRYEGQSRFENYPPYALFGDLNGNYRSGRLWDGAHTIKATPYTEDNGGGQAGPTASLTFEVRLVPRDNRGTSRLSSYPNPFNPTTSIQFELAQSGYTRLSVHDLLGRQVAVLADGERDAGEHFVTFLADHLASGVYLVRLQTAGRIETTRITLTK